MLRFSLATLLLLTAIVALGMAGLVNATPLWTQVVVTSVVLLLIGATVVAFHSKTSRPFISGFALAGWAYFLLTTTAIGGSARENLITTAALAKLYPVLHEVDVTNQGGWRYVFTNAREVTVTSDSGRLAWMTRPTSPPQSPTTHFHAIGHSLWALLIGGLGGMLAAACRQQRREEITAQ